MKSYKWFFDWFNQTYLIFFGQIRLRLYKWWRVPTAAVIADRFWVSLGKVTSSASSYSKACPLVRVCICHILNRICEIITRTVTRILNHLLSKHVSVLKGKISSPLKYRLHCIHRVQVVKFSRMIFSVCIANYSATIHTTFSTNSWRF